MPATTRPLLHFFAGSGYSVATVEASQEEKAPLLRIRPWDIDVHELHRRLEARNLNPSYERSGVSSAPPTGIFVHVKPCCGRTPIAAILDTCQELVVALDG